MSMGTTVEVGREIKVDLLGGDPDRLSPSNATQVRCPVWH